MGISTRMKLYAVLAVGVFLCTGLLEAQEVPPLPPATDAVVQRAEFLRNQAELLRKKQGKKDLSAARVLLVQSAQLFAKGKADDQAAEAYLAAADISILFSRYREARETYREVLRLVGDEARCKAMSRTARIFATTGPIAQAERSSIDALQLCKGLGQRAEAEALEARGEALESAGEYSQSADLLEQAAASFGAMGDGNAQAESLLMLAAALYSDGRHEESFRAARQALELWTSNDERYGIARVRAALGTFAIAKGEFETAQCNYKIAEPLLSGLGNRDGEASVLNGLGYASRELGDSQTSLEYYRKARSVFASIQDFFGEHEALTGMGKALFGMKRYSELVALYSEELRVAERSGDAALIASSLGDMAALYEAQNNYDLAELFYRRALTTYRKANHLYGEGDILLRLGRLQALRGRYEEALALLDQAKALKEKTNQIEEQAKIQYEKARILMKLHRLDEAKSSIEQTIEIIERQRITISQFDSRASYFASVHRYYAVYIDLLMQLHAENPELGFAKKAFEASERSKVRSLLDLLTTSARDADCGELLAKQLEDPSAAKMEEVSAQPANTLLAPTVTLEQAQAALEDDTILLEYSLGDERSFLWAVDRNEVVPYELPKSIRVRGLVERLRAAMLPPALEKHESVSDYQSRVHNMDRAYQATSRELSRLLLGPIRMDRFKRVLIVPDGVLQYAPFAGLPDPAPAANGAPLIVHYEVDVLPSISALATVRATRDKRQRPRAAVAIFADPVFEQDDPRIDRRSRKITSTGERPNSLSRAIRDTGRAQYIPRLPASRDEANKIAEIFRLQGLDVEIALDFDASRRNVLRKGLSGFQVIHFATHGVVDVQRPELSGLILSLVDARGEKQDGYLRMNDIYQLKLTADLVVLSSCESALGKDLESEGIIGLPRAFLYAGAKSVIASSWKVDDEATAKLMSALYRRIKKGDSAGVALRGAQIEMLLDPRLARPYYWAAFAIQGEYR
jgi:CHAT domain-containing protein/tetratricopeptide (TPR) repeat protein